MKSNAKYIEKLKPFGIINIDTYIGSLKPILHECTICKYRWVNRPNNILNGRGCPSCKKKTNLKKSNIDYFKLALMNNLVLLDKYAGSDINLNHKCLNCGYLWFARPTYIRQGRACPGCSIRRSPQPKNKVYLVYFDNLEIYKVGISSNPEARLNSLSEKYTILFLEYYETELEAREREKVLLASCNTLINTGLLKNGNTETFIIGE